MAKVEQMAKRDGAKLEPESDTKGEALPPAGPHAKPELTDREKTQGSGVLPEPHEDQTEAPTG